MVLHAPSLRAGIMALNVSANTVLLIDATLIEPDAIFDDEVLCSWLHSRGVCPQIIVVTRNRGESIHDAIKCLSVDDLEKILAEVKAMRVSVVGSDVKV